MLNRNKQMGFIKSAQSLTRNEMKGVLGSDIRKYRDEKCYTQSYMANQLGIGQSAYQKIESGDVKVSMGRLIQIASILDKPIDVFLNRNKEQATVINNINNPTINVSENEWNLMQKIIIQQEKRIEELEEKIVKREQELVGLKVQSESK